MQCVGQPWQKAKHVPLSTGNTETAGAQTPPAETEWGPAGKEPSDPLLSTRTLSTVPRWPFRCGWDLPGARCDGEV